MRLIRPSGRCAALLAAAGFVAICAAPSSAAPVGKPAQAGKGTLSIKVRGLPSGERARASVRGPRGYRKSLTRSASLRRLTLGRYTINVSKVTLRRARSGLKRGAVASPVKRRLSVNVKKGRGATAPVRYGTIINPGVRKAPGGISEVLGNADDPAGAVFTGRKSFPPGTILSAPPGSQFPKGLLAHVASVQYSAGKTTVEFTPANIYEVAPSMTFDVPLKARQGVTASAARCDDATGVKPYKRIKNPRVSGSWNTLKGLGIPVGVRVDLSFTAEAGVNVTGAVGGSCSLSAPPVAVQGAIGLVPVYGAISGDLHAGVAAGVTMNAGGSVRVDAGAETVGAPPALIMVPNISFSSPKFSLSAEVFGEATAGIGIKGEIGLGAKAANVHVALDNTLNFTAKPESCAWDLDLGRFSAGGKIAKWGISTPGTPPLYHRNLWHGCEKGPGDPSTWQLSEVGIGPLRFGMTESQARATGSKLDVEPSEYCDIWKVSGLDGPDLIASREGGWLRHAWLGEPRGHGAGGIEVGDGRAKLKAAFGDRLEPVPVDQDYYANLHMEFYRVYSSDRSTTVQFTIDTQTDKVMYEEAGYPGDFYYPDGNELCA
jgi:hypothetical protein